MKDEFFDPKKPRYKILCNMCGKELGKCSEDIFLQLEKAIEKPTCDECRSAIV